MSKPSDRNIIALLIKIMLWGAVVAMAYVILKSCATPKLGLESYKTGGLSKLVVLAEPPARFKATFSDEAGNTVTLADKRGKLVLVNFWATWCAPCIAELPSLAALQSQYDPSEFEVIAISLDRDIKDAREFLDGINANALELYHDASFGTAREANASGIPVSILYSTSGGELARLTGEADWNSRAARGLIDHVLGK